MFFRRLSSLLAGLSGGRTAGSGLTGGGATSLGAGAAAARPRPGGGRDTTADLRPGLAGTLAREEAGVISGGSGADTVVDGAVSGGDAAFGGAGGAGGAGLSAAAAALPGDATDGTTAAGTSAAVVA